MNDHRDTSLPGALPGTLLGGMSARAFLARHWQKQPLLVRGAVPGMRNLAGIDELFRIAERDDCESRLVTRTGSRWTLEHGPFARTRRRTLPAKQWTLLVQGLNHFLPAADALMRRFAFVPYARLDDVMVSYAATDGGVGPHVDSYDVFLLQGEGRRRWRISYQRDQEVDPRAPLKMLQHFRAEQEWVLEPGDMLYLPPGVAHDGVALDPCMTYSIGFRAPSAQELAQEFLSFVQDGLDLDGRYADADLAPQRQPAQLGDAFVDRAARMLEAIRWKRADIERFLGQYLSEPKAHVQFEPPARPLARRAFEQACARRGVRLALPTQMLYRGTRVFINGEAISAPSSAGRALRRLADERKLAPHASHDTALAAMLHEWYRAGFVLLGAEHE